MPLLYTTARKVEIFAEPGKKSPLDFIVQYREPNKRLRTPKHIHLVVDLFAKRTGNLALTNALLDHIIENIILRVMPVSEFPPRLQTFTLAHVKAFEDLDNYGEYSVEFLLVITELIMIQEKTNYPQGKINLDLFRKLRAGADIFTIVSAATFR